MNLQEYRNAIKDYLVNEIGYTIMDWFDKEYWNKMVEDLFNDGKDIKFAAEAIADQEQHEQQQMEDDAYWDAMEMQEATKILNTHGFMLVENRHFDFWQFKLQVKKILNRWLKTEKWFKTFDEMRGSISWELGIDIVKDSMKDGYNAGHQPEAVADSIIGLAKEAREKW